MESNSFKSSETHQMTRREFLWLSSMSAAGFVAGCAVNPVTGKQQFMIVSESSEIQIDKQNSPHQFSTDYGILQDNALNSYVNQVGRKLIPHTHRQKMPYSFQGVNATYINAYAFPGGSIAVTRGILLKLDNEAELAALLGHELGHVNARHTAQQMSKGTLASLVLSGVSAYIGQKYSQYSDLAQQLGMLGAGALLASYSRDNEREADALGNQYMVQSGYSTQGFVGLMEMLNSLSKNKSGATNLLFSTHPMSDERFRAAQENARTKYQASQSLPLNAERYMDNTSRLRQIKDAIEAMQKSDTAMGAQKYDEAETYLRNALKRVPNDYAGLLMMAKCQLAQGNDSEAQAYADQAKQAYPREAQAYHVSGFAKLKGNSFDAAYQDFSRCEALLPKNPGMAFFKGYALEGMGRRDQSAAEYNRYLQSVREGDNAKHAYQRLVEWGYIKTQK